MWAVRTIGTSRIGTRTHGRSEAPGVLEEVPLAHVRSVTLGVLTTQREHDRRRGQVSIFNRLRLFEPGVVVTSVPFHVSEVVEGRPAVSDGGR
jgi:hypothetical protein